MPSEHNENFAPIYFLHNSCQAHDDTWIAHGSILHHRVVGVQAAEVLLNVG